MEVCLGFARRAYDELSGDRTTGARPTAATASHTACANTGPTTGVTVRPSRTEATDSTTAVATGAPGELAWTGHGIVLLQHGLD